ncbi:MAG: GNAT family N-acetyltransferase [Chloroflexota bacterium]|nr:GNAT family N-acetyltransferase [Chloroflexota bacterium]
MHQRNIRKSERSELRVEFGHSVSDIKSFYRLHLLTRRRLGVPIQPRRFFDLWRNKLADNGLGFVLSVHLDQIPIAAAVFLSWNGTLVYKYGASDPMYWEHRPNNLLFWTAIRWGCEHGFHTFDWGRTDLDDQGLRDFKTGWGAKEEPLTYSFIANTPFKPSSDRLKKAMGIVIRRSSPWVCRTMGELLYRYAS